MKEKDISHNNSGKSFLGKIKDIFNSSISKLKTVFGIPTTQNVSKMDENLNEKLEMYNNEYNKVFTSLDKSELGKQSKVAPNLNIDITRKSVVKKPQPEIKVTIHGNGTSTIRINPYESDEQYKKQYYYLPNIDTQKTDTYLIKALKFLEDGNESHLSEFEKIDTTQETQAATVSLPQEEKKELQTSHEHIAQYSDVFKTIGKRLGDSAEITPTLNINIVKNERKLDKSDEKEVGIEINPDRRIIKIRPQVGVKEQDKPETYYEYTSIIPETKGSSVNESNFDQAIDEAHKILKNEPVENSLLFPIERKRRST